MDSFYNTILMVALVFLILGLAYSGYLLYYYQTAQEIWPKTKGTCPDTWIYMGKSDTGLHQCMIPLNCPNLGKNNFAQDDPNGQDEDSIKYGNVGDHVVYTYDSSTGLFTFEDLPKCDLKVWADLREIIWDGVTNYNNC